MRPSATTLNTAKKKRLLRKFDAWALLDYGCKHAHAIYPTQLAAEMAAERTPGIKIQKVKCVAVGNAKETPW